ncbi:MAG: hypothetical protein HY665_05030 [Chloroflexi bacterium]|nr:hypothetical protein [Chloroflexota bacterium]
MMSAKAYVLLDIIKGKSEQAVQTLRGKPGVVMADVLEGPPDLILVVEAPQRQKLATLVTQALASVETVTENLQLLPAQDGVVVRTLAGPSRKSKV